MALTIAFCEIAEDKWFTSLADCDAYCRKHFGTKDAADTIYHTMATLALEMTRAMQSPGE